MLKNRIGFSLIELMIVVAGLAGVAVVGMQLQKTQERSSSKGKLESDILLTTNEINAILSDPAKCLTTLGGKNAVSTTNGINVINGNKYFSVASGSAPTNGYGNSNLLIQNYELSATNAEVSSNNSALIINYQNKNILKGSSGPSNISKKINLYVEVDASKNITTCRSLSSSSTDIWSRGTGSDIYYTGGNVGIGTNAPVTSLQVAGAIMPGDQTQAITCNVSTEGSQRYNKTLHQMEYCGYNAGPPVSYAWMSLGGAGNKSGTTAGGYWLRTFAGWSCGGANPLTGSCSCPAGSYGFMTGQAFNFSPWDMTMVICIYN